MLGEHQQENNFFDQRGGLPMEGGWRWGGGLVRRLAGHLHKKTPPDGPAGLRGRQDEVRGAYFSPGRHSSA
jgi:hypothetical protein